MTQRPSCLLFCPGHRPERFDKALESGTPGIVLDLEDGVGADQKAAAREASLAWLARQVRGDESGGQPLLTLRINEPRSAHGLEDLYALVHAGPLPQQGWLLVPKLEDAGELAWLVTHLHRALPMWRVCGLIETGRGLRKLPVLAAQPRLAALGFGGADLRADLGLGDSFEAQLYARSRFVAEASGHGLHLMDVPHLNLDAPQALHDECLRVQALGFRGKFAIHPRQVAVIAKAFAPSEQAVAAARRVVHAVEAAAGSATQLDGRMVDQPMYLQALAVLEQAGSSPLAVQQP